MQKHRGFTLIEIMVVVAIVAIMASVLVPKIMDRPEQARRVKAKQDVLAIESALNLYFLDNSHYPSESAGLKALVEPETNPAPENWRPYLKHLPKDPWGHAYQYHNPGQHNNEIDVYALDKNGEHAAIGNWD